MGFLIAVVGCIISVIIGILTDSIILSLCLILFSCLAGTIILMDSNKDSTELKEKKVQELKQKAKEAYDRKYKSIVMPDSHYIVDYNKGDLNLLKGQQYCWMDEDNSLCLFPCDPPNKLVFMSKVNLIKIAKDHIDYYMVEGEITESTRSNEAGEKEKVTYDTRRVTMKCKDDEGEDRLIEFGFNNLSILKALLPGKEKTVEEEIEEHIDDTNAEANTINENTEIVDKAKSITEQIREIAKLKEEGILSEEEFDDKKKILLNRI